MNESSPRLMSLDSPFRAAPAFLFHFPRSNQFADAWRRQVVKSPTCHAARTSRRPRPMQLSSSRIHSPLSMQLRFQLRFQLRTVWILISSCMKFSSLYQLNARLFSSYHRGVIPHPIYRHSYLQSRMFQNVQNPWQARPRLHFQTRIVASNRRSNTRQVPNRSLRSTTFTLPAQAIPCLSLKSRKTVRAISNLRALNYLHFVERTKQTFVTVRFFPPLAPVRTMRLARAA